VCACVSIGTAQGTGETPRACHFRFLFVLLSAGSRLHLNLPAHLEERRFGQDSLKNSFISTSPSTI
jgi:hypothetical protein